MIDTDAFAREQFVALVSPLVGSEMAADLFGLFNHIALLQYEDAESTGFLVLCPPEVLSTGPPLITFQTPFDLHDIRAVRKMLQVSEQRLRILCTGTTAHGFATGMDHPNTITIQFQKHGMWEVRKAGAVVLQVNELAFTTVTQEWFLEVCRNVFGAQPQRQTQLLWNLVEAAKRQSRGTNVLISAEAAAEADRLRNQCTRLAPVALTPALMERLTCIDGTVIIDPSGVCYAIGAILDGAVSPRGDRTRGGRFNSALMYIDSNRCAAIIIVVSQNGTVDLVSRAI